MFEYIMKGGISIHPNFFGEDQFDRIKAELNSPHYLTYKTHYQPDTYYGNRLQAYPCYESYYGKENEYCINKLEDILKVKIIDFNSVARRTILDEIKQSKQNFGKYGFTHRDVDFKDLDRPMMAGMMYFDQSFEGGTAFFENHWDKVPDIYVSAYPNRLVLYHGGRWHAPALDYTFKERVTLSFFFTTDKKVDNQVSKQVKKEATERAKNG